MINALARRSTQLAVALVAAPLLLVGTAAPSFAATDTTTAVKWNTYPDWDGTTYLWGFGNPDTATYGQSFTAPEGVKKLKKFQFAVGANTGTGTMTVRGELYGWDGSKATDMIWESKNPTTIDLTQGDPTWHKVKMKLKKKGKVTAGQQYVMFLTVSKDYEDNPVGLIAQWGMTAADALPNSQTVWINDTGDESRWTTETWSGIPTQDFALKAKFK